MTSQNLDKNPALEGKLAMARKKKSHKKNLNMNSEKETE
jgi:hypothetical protein